MAKKFYLTTTLPYVNADPHLGFALEMVHADIIARYKRLSGAEVFFSTGTDEHGQKVFQKAKEEGKDIQPYVDLYADRFRSLKVPLNLSYDAFIRTTDPHHIQAAQELWRRCEKDIEKKKYKGLYCVGDELFLKENDLVNGKCPNHPNMEPVEIEEENYFFKLSSYQDKLLEYLSRADVILPEWRRQEAITFVKQGLEDFSISREKTRMSWGVPVPGDDSQVMYVWFDALTNYISTLGWPEDMEGKFKNFWEEGEVVQVAGKDQVRFQSVMWQAMLMSASIKNTDKVVYHGFINSGGQKMSKSIGNVIDPLGLVEEYDTDTVRHFLAQHIHPFEDSDFTMERFRERYNSDLANGLGNLAARIMQLAEINLTEPVIEKEREEDNKFKTDYIDTFEAYRVDQASDYVFREISRIDEEITQTRPFSVIKENPELGRELISGFVQELRRIARLLEPFMPETSKKIIDAIVANKKPDNLFPRKD